MKISIDSETLSLVEKQIKQQQRAILLSPILYMFLFILCWGRNNFKSLPWYYYIISIYAVVVPSFFFPILSSIRLGKLIYIVDKSNSDVITFVTFGTLWRDQRTMTVNVNDIKVNAIKERKLLYKKYELNAVYVHGKKFLIFSELLPHISKYPA